MTIYQAVSEDIVMTAGGPMGSPVEENWQRFFKSIEAAKRACEDDLGKAIKWRNGRRKNSCSSGDLGHVMYNISPVKVEE